jgi:hypothetical protein
LTSWKVDRVDRGDKERDVGGKKYEVDELIKLIKARKEKAGSL